MSNSGPIPNSTATAHIISSTKDGAFTPTLGTAGIGLLHLLVSRGILPPGGVTSVRDESLSILNSCAAPAGKTAKRTGLICGYVQSGKTLSMEMVSALAKDSGFRIVVLIAGVTTNLVDQSLDRMGHLPAGAGGYDWIMLKNPRIEAHGQIVSLLQEWRDPTSAINAQMLLITVMKNTRHLGPLAELLSSLDLEGIPAIIFDDEADQASLNTRPTSPRPSPVYQAIEDLRLSLPHHTFLQYTATPQAPLLISRIDSLSADFAELISPGDGYVGGGVFFRDRIDLVSVIPSAEIFDHTNLPAEPPASLISALQVFFVAVASKYVSVGSPTGYRSMLIHPHMRRQVHDAYLSWVEHLKKDWVAILASSSDPDRASLLREFGLAYQELSKTVADLPAFEAIAEKLRIAIGRTIPTLVNSDNGEEIPWKNGYAHVLVGGEKLGRGYTVKGLTVTYMPRGPGGWTADTVQQRARFFGYHALPNDNYLGYCRVYLHASVRDAYVAYIEHEEDMRTQIGSTRGKSLKGLKRAFFLDKQLRPTRHNIMKKLYDRPRFNSGWFEQRAPQAAPNGGAENTRMVTKLESELHLTADSFTRHYFADVNLTGFLENFLIPFSCPDERDEIPMCAIRLTLADEIDRDPDLTCRVVFMDLKVDPRERRVDGGTLNLQQGRSSSDDPNRYPGDRNIAENAKNRVTVQIHKIRAVIKEDGPSGTSIITSVIVEGVPALAIYLPSDMRRETIVQGRN
jgi:Z1 domain